MRLEPLERRSLLAVVFGGPNAITTAADGAFGVFAADVDGDGDTDVLSASFLDNKIAWYENKGSQNFTSHTITTNADGALSVFAVDVDGDGDIDVLSASADDNKIAWYENDGNENFSSHTITTDAILAFRVFAADVDGDGDIDVLSASVDDNKIAWYENDGNENFTSHIITTFADGAASVFAEDVDGDGDTDILSASIRDHKIAWYENDGNENFTSHTITTEAAFAVSVFAADVDGDGDTDVLSASEFYDEITWYENDGNENFTSHTITTAADGAFSVFATDLDGDGDTDVLSASIRDHKVAWYENDGNENFRSHTITTAAHGASTVFAADVDGDGDIDVLSSSRDDHKIAWYEHRINAPPIADAGGQYAINEGENLALNALGSSDFDGDLLSYRWDVDGDGDFDENISGAHPTVTWARLVSLGIDDGPDGPRTITLEVFDGAVAQTDTAALTVNNTAPALTLGGISTATEGSLYTLTLGAVSDPGNDTVTQYIVHWGDGTSDTFGSGGDVTHTYSDGPATHQISVDLVDEDGTFSADNTVDVTVDNVAPTIALSGAPSAVQGDPYTLSLGAVAEPGDDTVTEYIVRWGDGTTDTFNSAGDVSHTYALGDVDRVITVDLLDEDGTHVDAGSLPVEVKAKIMFVSFGESGVIGNGIAYHNEDILAYNFSSQDWSMFIDGSELGLESKNINAFHINDEGTIDLSFDSTILNLGGLPRVEDVDVVRFTPTGYGVNTAGTFAMHFDGSDVGLTPNLEGIDALSAGSSSHSLVISTTGDFAVPGVSGNDTDLIEFSGTFGENTSGVFTLKENGADFGLASISEDVTGVSLSSIYLTTNGDFTVNGASGDAADIIECDSDTNTCVLALDGGASGVASGSTFDAVHDGSFVGNENFGASKTFYISTVGSGSVAGVSFDDEDILAFDTQTGVWSMFFDGSDVLPTAVADIDAFEFIGASNDIAMSFLTTVSVPGVGTVNPEDVVTFSPTSTGSDTAGSLALTLDGSAFGLSGFFENVDALVELEDGSLAISTTGNVSANGANGGDEDLLKFNRGAGTFELLFDGSDVGLDLTTEDVTGAALVPGGLELNTLGQVAVAGFSGGLSDTLSVPARWGIPRLVPLEAALMVRTMASCRESTGLTFSFLRHWWRLRVSVSETPTPLV